MTGHVSSDRSSRRRFRRVADVLAVVGAAAGTAAVLLVVVGGVTGSWRVVPVRSGSMAPVAPKGSAVLATPSSSARLHVGDVVLFKAPTTGHPLVVHRIHEVVVHDGERLYRTKGDANAAADPWLIRLPAKTVWQVHHVIPVLGTVVAAVSKPVARLVGLFVAVLALLCIALGRIWSRASGVEPGRATPAELATTAAAAATAASIATAFLGGDGTSTLGDDGHVLHGA